MFRGFTSRALTRLSHIHQKDRQSTGLVRKLVVGGGAGQQQHQVRLQHPGDEDLLPVDHVTVALAHGGGANARGLGAGVGLRDPERLEPDLPAGHTGQIAPLLLRAAVAQERAHGVHLGMTRGGVAAPTVDLLQDDARLGDPQTDAAVLLGDQRRQPAQLRELPYEHLRILAFGIHRAPVGVGIVLADLADLLPELHLVFGEGEIHHECAVLYKLEKRNANLGRERL